MREASLDNQRIKGKPGHGGVPGSPEQRYCLVGTGTVNSLYVTAPEELLRVVAQKNSLAAMLLQAIASQRVLGASGAGRTCRRSCGHPIGSGNRIQNRADAEQSAKSQKWKTDCAQFCLLYAGRLAGG